MQVRGGGESLIGKQTLATFRIAHCTTSQSVESMDNQTSSNGDRPRTSWTIAMDRYFADIMLEQVNKGFKRRSSFTKNAWEDIINLINTKFGLQLDKEILQNRSKKFKHQYNTIKLLLKHNGFLWDETKQMIIADDNTWDEYLKEHPEAKSFRTRSMPNYNSFCVIYGDESANQVGKIANDMTMVPFDDKDPHGVRSSQALEFVDKQTPGNSDRLRTTWTPTMDRYFIELMIEQVHRGYKNNTMFRKKAWKIMVTSFNEHFGLGVEKDVLKNRLKKLRLRYNIIKSLLDHGGFCWDETRQMVTADDHVWDDYVKAHPEARPFRTITIPEHTNLSIVFGSENSKGRSNSSGRSNAFANHIINEKIGGESGGSQSPTISAAHGDQCVMQAQPEAWAYKIKTWPDSPVDMPESSSHSDGGLDTYNHLGKRPLSEALNPSNSRKARRGTDEAMVDVLRQMALAVTSLANNKNENENSISCEQVVNALKAVPDIDEDLFLDACDLLEDEGKAKMFLALDVTIRKKWLMRKLRP